MKRWMFTITLMALMCLSAFMPAWSAQRYALLVSVGHYQDRDVPSLASDGEQGDIEFMRDALKKRFGGTVTIIELPEAKATKQNILDALKTLAEQAQPGDTVIFYFSGHGGRINGHLSLCPYDAPLHSSAMDITDETLNDWVKTLKTKNTTIILDCCFNEYHLKGIRHRPKFMPRDDMTPIQPLAISEESAVVLQASKDNEEAQEFLLGPGPNGPEWVGVFSYWLCDAMARANPETTYRQLIQRVDDSVSRFLAPGNNSFSQCPQLHGSDALIDRPLFAPLQGGATTDSPHVPQVSPPPPYVVVHSASKGEVTLDTGQKAGITVGSEYSVFSDKEKAFTPDHQIGVIRITEVDANKATATIVEGSVNGKIKRNCRAVEKKHKENIAEQARVRVRLEAPHDSEAPIQQALRGLDFVDMDATPADLILKVSSNGDNLTGTLYAPDGNTRVGEPVIARADGPQDLVTKLSPRLENFVVLRGLASMQNPNPALTVSLQTGKPVYHLGDKFSVQLKVNGDQDCYLALIHVNADGIPQVLFPNQFTSETKIHGGHEYAIPSGELGFDKFNIEVTPPTGRETIVAIATLDPVDWTKATRATVKDQGTTLTAKGLEVVGSSVQSLPLSHWGMALTSFIIEDAK